MIKLTNPGETYELKHPAGAVFTLKEWTMGMQADVDRSCIVHENGQFRYDVPLERQKKLEHALAGWTGVSLDGETEAECNAENRKMLPVGIQLWLVRNIDLRAGLALPEEEKKN